MIAPGWESKSQIKDGGEWCFSDYLCGLLLSIPDMIKGIYVDYFVSTKQSFHRLSFLLLS